MAANSSTDDATVTAVAASTSAVTLFAATGQVSSRPVFNDSTAVLYLKFGSGAATNSYTTQVASGGYFEVPGYYSGQVTGVWAAANGSAYCTEVS